MNTVQPIRNKRDIEKMKKALGRERDRLLFIIGINSALRISDILKLKVGDVRGKTDLTLRETKTGKAKRFHMNKSITTAVKQYVPVDADNNDYLFRSREGANRPISRVQAYNILNAAADRSGVKESVGEIGTHTLRKTFAYHAYKAGNPIAVLQSVLNHSSAKETLRYIGIQQDDIDAVYVNLNL